MLVFLAVSSASVIKGTDMEGFAFSVVYFVASIAVEFVVESGSV